MQLAPFVQGLEKGWQRLQRWQAQEGNTPVAQEAQMLSLTASGERNSGPDHLPANEGCLYFWLAVHLWWFSHPSGH
jgi:hypothetical protein